MRKYGLPYKGSKSAIAENIIEILPAADTFVDLFAGGCAMTHAAMLSGKYKRFIINDIEGDITQLFMDATAGKYHDERRWISRDEFFLLKDFDPYVRYCWSFGNDGRTYLYGREIEPYKKALHEMLFAETVHERRLKWRALCKNLEHLESLQSLQSLERLQSLQSLEHLERLQSLERYNLDYQDVTISDGAVIYCDIPHKGENDYGKENSKNIFDYRRFYNWAIRQKKYLYQRVPDAARVPLYCGNEEKISSMRNRKYWSDRKDMDTRKKLKCEIYRDSMQNYKKYAIPPAQLIIADVPYNVGNNFYGSNPTWYIGGDNKNGESKLAGKAAFNSDFNFNLYEYFHFCSKMLKKDDKSKQAKGRSSDSPCMIVFCSFEQTHTLIQAAKKHGFVNYIPLFFVKNYSPQVLKANMRIVGATEIALLLYRNKLPKFRNGVKVDAEGKNIRGTGSMVFNWFSWESDGKEIPKIHPAQKPVKVLKRLIEVCTDPGDVVIDPCCGSGSTLRAAHELGRQAFGFEIDRNFYTRAKNEMLNFSDERVEADPCGTMSIFEYLKEIEA